MPPKPDDKRQKILDAALTLFARHGYDGTPVPQIAEAAGVAAGTIYRYFPSKLELVNALFRQWKAALHEALQRGFPLEASPRAQFEHLWRAMEAFNRGEPRALVFLDMHYHKPHLDAQSLAVEEELMSFARAFVVTAQERGALAPLDPELAIAVVFGIFLNVVKQRDACRLGQEKAVLDAAAACAWAAIAKQPET